MKSFISKLLFPVCLLLTSAIATNEVLASTCEYSLISSQMVEWDKNQLPTIEGKVNQETIQMLLDTGASQSYLLPSLTTKLGVIVSKPKVISDNVGIGGSISRSITRVQQIEFGSIRVEKPYFFVINNLKLEPYFEVILGSDYLHNFDMELSYQERMIRFYSTRNCSTFYINNRKNTVYSIPLLHRSEEQSQLSFIAKINGKSFKAMIDTGSSGKTIISSEAAIELGIYPSEENVDESDFAIGAGDQVVSLHKSLVKKIEIGELTLHDTNISIGNLSSVKRESGVDVIFGGDFLKKFRVLFSVSQNKIYASME